MDVINDENDDDASFVPQQILNQRSVDNHAMKSMNLKMIMERKPHLSRS